MSANKGENVKNKFLFGLVFYCGILTCGVLFADDTATTESLFLQILTFVTTLKGASTIAIAAGVVQLVMLFFKTPLAAFAGKYKLLVVSALTVPALILAAVVTGMPLSAALGQAPVLAAVQSLLYQAWKQFLEPAGPQPL